MISINSSHHYSSQIVSHESIRIIYSARIQKHIYSRSSEHNSSECSLSHNDTAWHLHFSEWCIQEDSQFLQSEFFIKNALRSRLTRWWKTSSFDRHDCFFIRYCDDCISFRWWLWLKLSRTTRNDFAILKHWKIRTDDTDISVCSDSIFGTIEKFTWQEEAASRISHDRRIYRLTCRITFHTVSDDSFKYLCRHDCASSSIITLCAANSYWLKHIDLNSSSIIQQVLTEWSASIEIVWSQWSCYTLHAAFKMLTIAVLIWRSARELV